jgi:hypothetical protein
VFTAEGGTWLWRSTFIRCVLNPAVNGNEEGRRSGVFEQEAAGAGA